MRGSVFAAAVMAAPACGQWVLVAPTPYLPPPPNVPVFLSGPAAPTAYVSAKPPAPAARRVLVERHYLDGPAGSALPPPPARNPADGEFDQIIREYYFGDAPKAKDLKAVPREGEGAEKPPEKPAEPPKRIALPPVNSTGEDEPSLFDKLGARTKAPPPTAADRTPNGASGYPPAANIEALRTPGSASEALAIAAAPVTGLAKAPRGATPYAEAELRFLHHAGAGKRFAEQACRTDRKGEFSTNLEPGLWSVMLVLPGDEGFEKLGSLKVLPKGPNTFRPSE